MRHPFSKDCRLLIFESKAEIYHGLCEKPPIINGVQSSKNSLSKINCSGKCERTVKCIFPLIPRSNLKV